MRAYPEENIPEGRAGRKPIAGRQVLEWILNTEIAWALSNLHPFLSC
jgi:hypothetical protein